ncbi:hypothetical protein LCGC14_2705590 [marine sediment metagenome]|uniref:Uncharacterized protein n=1 Tax=marine sediment metagenome TaxID=412755 RepID=A0A0F9C681_9ZZZZ
MEIITKNKKAYFNYEILEKFEAGISLIGQEVKSIKLGKINLAGSYVIFRSEEVYLIGANVPPYQPKNAPKDYNSKRSRKLLLTTDNEDLIMEYTRKWECKQSGIDAGAGTLGVSVYDHLQKIDDMKRRIIAMNNRQISINQEEGKQRLFNEDMHDNLRALGERGEIHIYNRPDIKASFRSVRWDRVRDAHGLWKIKISGRETHIVEGAMRAIELASKDISLNIFARRF